MCQPLISATFSLGLQIYPKFCQYPVIVCINSCHTTFYCLTLTISATVIFDEKDIIRGCLEGNRVSQKRLYDHFASRMLGVCMRYAKDRAEAEDMLQEGFIKVFNNISRFKHEGSFEGWIRRIMVFTAINIYRYRSRKFQESYDTEDCDAVYDDNVIDQISTKEIVALIQHLPEGYRMVFNLYALEGYSHREIGELLGVAEGTSKSQYSRARLFMQQLLAKHYRILNEPFQEPK